MSPTGHFAVGLVAKRFAPKVPLGVLLLATEVIDLLFFLFVHRNDYPPGIVQLDPAVKVHPLPPGRDCSQDVRSALKGCPQSCRYPSLALLHCHIIDILQPFPPGRFPQTPLPHAVLLEDKGSWSRPNRQPGRFFGFPRSQAGFLSETKSPGCKGRPRRREKSRLGGSPQP